MRGYFKIDFSRKLYLDMTEHDPDAQQSWKSLQRREDLRSFQGEHENYRLSSEVSDGQVTRPTTRHYGEKSQKISCVTKSPIKYNIFCT